MASTICTLSFPATFLEVRNALADVRQAGQAMDLCRDCLAVLEQVLAEALNNIVEHAYPDASPGPVELELDHAEGAIECHLTDFGLAMPEKAVPLGKPQPMPHDPKDLPEGGFGWFLIHALTQEVRYTRALDRNRLSFKLLCDD